MVLRKGEDCRHDREKQYWGAAWFHEQGVTQIRVQAPLGGVGASTFWITPGFRPQARLWWKALAKKIVM